MADDPRDRMNRAVVVTGIAVHEHDELQSARDAFDDAGRDVEELSCVIYVAQSHWGDRPSQSAAGVCAGLRVRGQSVTALDVVEDGCGVPSSIAVGSSVLAQRGGVVLVVADGAALVLAGTEASTGASRVAVERVLATVDSAAPIVAVLPEGRSLQPAATAIGGLLKARTDGFREVVLVTAAARGRAAAVVCHFGGHTPVH